MCIENKIGRPKKWISATTRITIPKEYAAALLEIAFEWQLNLIDDSNKGEHI